MLQQLRNPYVMKYGMWIVLGITIPSFIAFYGFSTPPDQAGGTGEVNVEVETQSGKEVTFTYQDLRDIKQDAQLYYQSLLYRLPPQDAQLAMRALQRIPTKMVADYAVGGAALRDRLESQDIRVSTKQVSDYLKQVGYTRERARQAGLSEYELEQRVRQVLTNELAGETVARVAKVSLLELWQDFRLANDRLTASYVSFPVELDDSITVTPEQVQAKYDEEVARKSPRVFTQRQRIYEYVKLAAPFGDTTAISDSDVRAAYDATSTTDTLVYQEPGVQVRQILVPFSPLASEAARAEARTQAEEAAQRIEAGEDFSIVADEVSLDLRNMQFQDAETSPTLLGGLVPYTFKGTEEAAWGPEWTAFVQHADPGEVSPVLETEQGYAIVKIEERLTGGKRPYEEVSDAIRQRLQTEAQWKSAERRGIQITENITKLRDAASTETSIDGVARAVQAEVQTTSPTLEMAFTIPGIGSLSREMQALRDLEPGRLSPVLQTDTSDAIVLRIKEVVESRQQSLDEVRRQIELLARRDLAAEQARAQAVALRDRLTQSDDTLTSAAATLNLQASTLTDFTREAIPEALPRTAEAESALARAKAGDVLLLANGSPESPTDFFVVEVLEVKEPSRADFVAQIPQFESGVLMEKRQAHVDDFRQDAVKTLKVDYGRALLEEDDAPSRRRRQRQGG